MSANTAVATLEFAVTVLFGEAGRGTAGRGAVGGKAAGTEPGVELLRVRSVEPAPHSIYQECKAGALRAIRAC